MADAAAAETPALSLNVGQVVSGIYTILDRDDPDTLPETETDKVARPLGRGGSKTVYLASYRRMQKRAIEFLTLNYLSGSTGKRRSDFQKTFNRERVFLSTLSHGHIARLYDTGTFEDAQGVTWQYIVTDYIDGDELLPALADAESAEQVYNAISDVLRAVSYMHDKNVLHADIKWENIKCRKAPTGVEAVILDLGTAHHVPDDSDDGQAELPFDADSTTRVRFITTKRITHMYHRVHSRGIVDKETLRQLFPSHDLHAIGVLLEELVEDSRIRRNLRLVIGDEGLQALGIMIYCLKKSPEPEPPAHQPDYLRVIQYTDIQQVYHDWQKLRRTYLAPVSVPELSLAAEFKYSVPTAAGRGVVTPRLAVLINHKLFQRLRRVPQLEMTLMKFPGATHTRFSHSLAVMRNTRYYLAHLLNDPSFRLLCEPADLQATILLALLHDVGHYQLVHMFEDYASDQRTGKNDPPWRDIEFDVPSDDDLFWTMVDPSAPSPLRGDYGNAIEGAWRNSEDRLSLPRAPTIREIICEQFDDATYEAMLRIHNAVYSPGSYTAPSPAQLVLGAVLSSDIDADKVAYLIEDADRSGVNFGAGVDFDGILGALRMPDVHDITDNPTLGITQKGLAAAQSVVVSRNLMVGQVYWQHTNRAATAMVKYVVARMLKRGVLKIPAYIGATLFLEYEASLSYLFEMFERESRNEIDEVNPIAGLIEGERRIYDTAFSTSRLDRDEGERVGDALTKKSFDGIITLEETLTSVVRDVSGLPDLKEGEVLVDVPIKERRPSGERGGQVFVYPTRTDTSGKRLRTYTPFLEAIKEQHRRENRICRVFVAPRIAASDNYAGVIAAINKYVRSNYGSD
jgi:HD superfamily phosphohydrolase